VQLAALTTTPIINPKVSTMICLFRPLIFLENHEEDGATHIQFLTHRKWHSTFLVLDGLVLRQLLDTLIEQESVQLLSTLCQ
jgi:hypothetical protein